jgi:hypothetical protein
MCEPYAACPHCLTEIADAFAEQKNTFERTGTETILSKENPTRNKENSADCNYRFGYLSEREKKGEIPDKCLSCIDILECMLRKMR